MDRKITRQIYKLLATDNLPQRIDISIAVFRMLGTVGDYGSVEPVMRKHLADRVKVCIFNPVSPHGVVLSLLANFYDRHYVRPQPHKVQTALTAV